MKTGAALCIMVSVGLAGTVSFSIIMSHYESISHGNDHHT